MATSVIQDNNLKSKVIWTNPNPAQLMGSESIGTNFTGIAKIVVVEFRLYATASYIMTNAFFNDGTNQNSSVVLSTIRYDGSDNFIVTRNVSYNFDTNKCGTGPGYKQSTYKTSSIDNYALVPLRIIAYY